MSYLTSAIIHAATPVALIIPQGILMQTNPARSTPDWHVCAIRAYHHARCQGLNALPELLATRVSALIGQSIKPADVFVDLDAERATVVVDGVVFRARNQQVVVLRSCVECGIKRFESAPLWSRADLGYALSAWQPHCRSCQPEDPADSE
jgi:hypothetical protein